MALSTTVSQRKKIKRKAPRSFLKRVFKRQKPHLRLETSVDLLVRVCPFFGWLAVGQRKVEEINPRLYLATPALSGLRWRRFQQWAGPVCSSLAGQFMFLTLSCSGARWKINIRTFLREAISHIILRKLTLISAFGFYISLFQITVCVLAKGMKDTVKKK